MKHSSHHVWFFLALLVLSSAWCAGQDQDVPDAPSAVKKPQPLPTTPPSVTAPQPDTTQPAPKNTNGNAQDSSSTNPANKPELQPSETPAQPPAHAPITATRVPPPAGPDSRNEIPTFVTSVNAVLVPVTVKDAEGRLVQGLQRNDFAVYENGVEQKINVFTSDPFPISAAVVIDLSLPESDLHKIKATLPALFGAFGQFDEVSVYTYSDTVQKVLTFVPPTSPEIDAVVPKLRSYTGEQGGVPVVGGPMNSTQPVINGKPVLNQGATPEQVDIQNYHQSARVLNDAILTAANDLASRAAARRRILFVISDGTERGSTNSYADTLKVLLSHNLSVYGVVVSPPALSTIERLKLPRISGANILPKYANATGGQWYSEFSQSSVEAAYSRVTEEARNQYTIGYTTRATLSTAYRSIEVRVHHPGLKVYARDGYYPLPPRRQ